MRAYETIDEEDGDKRSVLVFDTLTDLLDHNTEKDHRTAAMQDGSQDEKWYGCKSMQEADELARQGLPRLGVEAIEIAQDRLSTIQGDMLRNVFNEFYDTAGATVDMGRYVTGEPECMVNYFPAEELGQSPIVSLILNVSYNSGISPKAIKENGLSLMALIEAVESTGKSVEVWTDMHVKSWGGHWARTAVRLKRAGDVSFDAGAFMYALTHPSYLRAHIFNAMHSHPEEYRREIGIKPHGGYGCPVTNATAMDDFPPYSIYIPVMSHDSQAGKFVPLVLKQLGLTKA